MGSFTWTFVLSIEINVIETRGHFRNELWKKCQPYGQVAIKKYFPFTQSNNEGEKTKARTKMGKKEREQILRHKAT